jgi:hypothetical protein
MYGCILMLLISVIPFIFVFDHGAMAIYGMYVGLFSAKLLTVRLPRYCTSKSSVHHPNEEKVNSMRTCTTVTVILDIFYNLFLFYGVFFYMITF